MDGRGRAMVLVYELYGLMEILKKTKKSVEQQPLPETTHHRRNLLPHKEGNDEMA
jgi:hypothetical protein